MASIFTRIIKGELNSFKIFEDDDYFAFLDAFPVTKGHTLVVPKKEVDYLFDLDDKTYIGLMLISKKIAVAMKKVIPCKKISIIVQGLEVPHAHVHLIPFNKQSDLNFSNKIPVTDIDFKKISEEISSNMPHAHVHLIPFNKQSDLNFSNKIPVTDIDFKKISEEISSNIK
ncbi:HIT family protein [Ichthyobacterium seriolicida]|uniref:HIT family hydrolase n=1 Tax=Ichthyobacterium seriolicida TaxID=242600 RepID=A0A1J1E7X6_9FLAO|nr:HIT family protein [Ichthyobacterium seriolicida]BAV95438.1 HIT family hydrolase [Ichthyobacterium seriolicida]